MIIGEDFKFRDDLKQYDTVPIQLLKGQWEGVTLRYTQVAVKELDDNTAKLQFQYELIEMGEHTETNLRRSKNFEQYIGLVLNQMILEIVDNEQPKLGENNTEVITEE